MFQQTEYLQFDNLGILYFVVEIFYCTNVDSDYYDVFNFDVILN